MARSPQSQPTWVSALLDKDLTATERLTLVYLAWRQGRNGSAWPSQQTMAADLNMTEQGVRAITRRLKSKGRIQIVKPEGQGRGHHLRYSIITTREGSTAVNPSGDKPSTTAYPLERERVNGHTEKGSTAVETNTKENTTSTTTITYDWETHTFTGISEDYVAQCSEAYPAIDIPSEIRRAALWCRNNSGKAKGRKDWPRFLGNWFSRAQGDAEVAGRKQAASDDTPTEEEITAKARAGGSKLPWLTGEPAHV